MITFPEKILSIGWLMKIGWMNVACEHILHLRCFYMYFYYLFFQWKILWKKRKCDGRNGDNSCRTSNSKKFITNVFSPIINIQEAEEDFGTGKFSGHQKFLWDLMEHSDSSTAAQLVSVTSISFVAVSIVGMIVNTLEALQYTVCWDIFIYFQPVVFYFICRIWMVT